MAERLVAIVRVGSESDIKPECASSPKVAPRRRGKQCSADESKMAGFKVRMLRGGGGSAVGEDERTTSLFFLPSGV